jgi:hypothetical protein
MICNSSFHLALRQDVPAKDCGQVWIDDESQTLEFACDSCLGRTAPPAAAPAATESRPRYARRQGGRAADVLQSKRKKL